MGPKKRKKPTEKTTVQTVQTLARDASAFFEKSKRTNGDDYYKTKDATPKWVKEMVKAAHADMLPDDWRYTFVVEALQSISDASDVDDIHPEADIYTHDLLAWLASRNDRSAYCDDAVNEGICSESADTDTRIQCGQYMEKSEVLGSVLQSLRDRLESDDATADASTQP